MPHGLREHDEGLGRLLWMYLRLLVTRQAVVRVVEDADTSLRGPSLEQRLTDLEAALAAPQVGDDLRRSLTSQAEILRQRMAQQTEARGKQAYLDAELTRIEEQVELIREQAALSTNPELLSQRIDEIVATLGGTSQWIRDQQQVYGAMEDLLSERRRSRPRRQAVACGRANDRSAGPAAVARPGAPATLPAGRRSSAISFARARPPSSCSTATSSTWCRRPGASSRSRISSKR